MLRKLSNKHFWLLSAIVFLILTFFSYGFIRNLYFFREDYEDLYNCYTGENQTWPYQGAKYILYPFHLLFGDKPFGYFIIAFVLYVIFSLILAFFIWKITKSRLIALLSGSIFSLGYVGSESMFMVETAITTTFFLILLFTLLIFYKLYFESHSLKYWLVSFGLYLVCLLLVAQRAHYLFFVVFFTDWYLSVGLSIRHFLNNAFRMVKRLFPFVISFYWVYFRNKDGLSSLVILRQTEKYNVVAQLSFLSDLGNYLVPSAFQEKIIGYFLKSNYLMTVLLLTFVLFIFLILLSFSLKTLFTKRLNLIYLYPISFLLTVFILAILANKNLDLFLGSLIGVFWLYILVAFIFLIKLNKNYKKTLIFLALCWVISYFTFHLREPGWVHPSWSKYLIYAFPFFVATIIFIVVKVFIESQVLRLKILGWVILTAVVLSNFIAGNISPLRKKFIERGFYLKKFVSFLKKDVPKLTGMDLFYFDVVSHGPTQGLFDSFLAGGRANQELSLAFHYKANERQVKFARDYEDLVNEYHKGTYRGVYVFFYDIDKNLHSLNPYFSPNNKIAQLNIGDFSKIKMRLYSGLTDANRIETISNNILYESIIRKKGLGSESANDILELNLENFNFPSYKPVQLDIKLKATKNVSAIKDFPYADGLVLAAPKEYYLTDLRDSNSRYSLLTYISEREGFRRTAKVSSCGDEYPLDIKSIIDGDLGTPWVSSKKCDLPSWAEVELPAGYSFSEVRWISAYKNRLPITYDYQISDQKDGPWQTILSLKNRRVKVNEYVVDKIPPTIAKYFRMMINETNDNLPAISEIELLKSSSNAFSRQADFLMEHPLTKVNSQIELKEITEGLLDYLMIKVYPTSDKYLNKNQSPAIRSNIILGGREHTYSFILPAGGTKIKSILIEFPNIPLSAKIESITLKQIP